MKKTLEVINKLKERHLIKDYAIGGAIAALRWSEPFFTRGLDIFVILFSETKEKGLINLSPLYEYLKEKGYLWQGQWIIIEGLPVDIIPAGDLEQEAIKEAYQTAFEGIKTKVIRPEYLIAMFLKVGRDKDIRKIQMLYEQARIDAKKLKLILDRYGLDKKLEKFKKAP